jgi:hypothetical protein
MKNEITAQRAEWYKIAPQAQDEADGDFRRRVAGELRAMGHVIEAHEALQNRLYADPGDDGPTVMDGVTGALAHALHGVDWGDRRRVDDEAVTGAYLRLKKPDLDPDTAMLMMQIFGGNR